MLWQCVYELHQSLVCIPNFTYDMYVKLEKPLVVQYPGRWALKLEAVTDAWVKGSCRLFTTEIFFWGLPMLCVGVRHVSWFLATKLGPLFGPLSSAREETREAAGITMGLAPSDRGFPAEKILREQSFPFELLQNGAKFAVGDGQVNTTLSSLLPVILFLSASATYSNSEYNDILTQRTVAVIAEIVIDDYLWHSQASMPADKVAIVAEIGEHTKQLEQTVHGAVAGSAIRRAMEKGLDSRTLFLEALNEGAQEEVNVNLIGSEADTLDNIEALLNKLDPAKCRRLHLSTAIESIPEGFIGKLTNLRELSFRLCRNLKCLPEEFGDLQHLQRLDVQDCLLLKSLPDSLASVISLVKVDSRNCYSMTKFPDLSELPALKKKYPAKMIHDGIMLRYIATGISLPCWFLVVFLVRAARGCGWHLSVGVCAWFCWGAVFMSILVPLLFQDIRSVGTHLKWVYSG